MKKTILLSIFTFVTILSSFAQSSKIEMATALRSSGKIWVVVSVLLTIIIGVFIYMFTIDRRIKKLENDK